MNAANRSHFVYVTYIRTTPAKLWQALTEPEFVRHIAEHEGTVYAFCSVGCRTRFMKDPTAYIGAGSAEHTQA